MKLSKILEKTELLLENKVSEYEIKQNNGMIMPNIELSKDLTNTFKDYDISCPVYNKSLIYLNFKSNNNQDFAYMIPSKIIAFEVELDSIEKNLVETKLNSNINYDNGTIHIRNQVDNKSKIDTMYSILNER